MTEDDKTTCVICEWEINPEQLCKCCMHTCQDCCATERSFQKFEDEPKEEMDPEDDDMPRRD